MDKVRVFEDTLARARVCRASRNFSEAEKLYLEALEQYHSALHTLNTWRHPAWQCFVSNELAHLLVTAGRSTDAIARLQKTIQLAQRFQLDRKVTVFERHLLKIYHSLKMYDSMYPIFQSLIGTYEKLGNAKKLTNTLYGLAATFKVQNRFSEAEPIARRAVEVGKTCLSQNEFAVTLAQLATILYKWAGSKCPNKLAEAESARTNAIMLWKPNWTFPWNKRDNICLFQLQMEKDRLAKKSF